jgi:hypothetical protein
MPLIPRRHDGRVYRRGACALDPGRDGGPPHRGRAELASVAAMSAGIALTGTTIPIRLPWWWVVERSQRTFSYSSACPKPG